VARLGGDEFTVLLPEIADPGNAEAIAAKILSALKQPYRLAEREVSVTGSIGISLYPEHGEEPDALMKRADAAMYHVKEDGRAGQCLFRGDFVSRPAGTQELAGELQRALDKGEIAVWYQPQVSLETHKVVALEALARWRHPQRGSLAAADFLALAEESDLIVQIGAYVLRRACHQGAEWVEAGLEEVRIAVNLSPRQFADPDLVHTVRDALLRSGLAADRLELELSESLALQDMEESLRTARALAALGVRIAITDFGTAIYNGGQDLSALRVSTLKIAHALVRDIGIAPWPATTVARLIEARRVSGARIVALGVERPEQIERLREALCTDVQGHLVSRALSPEEVPALAGRLFAL
jgi:predicted signal transduction protein with EAL and GGDEF domain